jgi:hypothetical protein
VEYVETRKKYKIVIRKPHSMRPLARPKHIYEGNNKIDFRIVRCEMDCIYKETVVTRTQYIFRFILLVVY